MRIGKQARIAWGELPPQPPRELRTRCATEAEANRLLTQGPSWLQLLVQLCLTLALRSGEAMRITEESWNRSAREISVRTKGGRARVLPITDEIEALMRVACMNDAPKDTPLVWRLAGPRDGKWKRSIVTLQSNWHAWKKLLGVDPQLRLHDLRRTRATQIYRQTRDVRLSQQFLGHESLASTAYYLAPWDTEQLRKMLHDLTPPKGWKQ